MFNIPQQQHAVTLGVCRNRSGKLEVCELPLDSVLPVIDDRSRLGRTFERAVAYAKGALTNFNFRSIYKELAKGKVSPYARAVSDYFRAPGIMKINLSRYKGGIGESVDVLAEDDVMVTAVNVRIYDIMGNMVEGGRASIEGDRPVWRYRAQKDNPQQRGGRVVIAAADMPGNVTLREYVL